MWEAVLLHSLTRFISLFIEHFSPSPVEVLFLSKSVQSSSGRFFDKGGLGRCKSCPINGEPKASLSTAPRRLKSAVLVSYALLW